MFNTDWLNKTACKGIRSQIGTKIASGHVLMPRPVMIVWHHTASPNHIVSKGTLNYNLTTHVINGKRMASSYNYLIGVDGVIYWYVDEALYIAYGAGPSEYRIGDKTFRDADLNTFAIHVEMDLPGRREVLLTEAQRESGVILATHLMQKWDIPLTIGFHPSHKMIALPPGRKNDPIPDYRADILEEANKRMAQQQTPPFGIDERFYKAWFASGGVWQPDRLTPGYPQGQPFEFNGAVCQAFERGIARLNADGSISWLLRSEQLFLPSSSP